MIKVLGLNSACINFQWREKVKNGMFQSMGHIISEPHQMGYPFTQILLERVNLHVIMSELQRGKHNS